MSNVLMRLGKFRTQEEFISSACNSFETMLRAWVRSDLQTFNLAKANVNAFTLPDVLSDLRELPRES